MVAIDLAVANDVAWRGLCALVRIEKTMIGGNSLRKFFLRSYDLVSED